MLLFNLLLFYHKSGFKTKANLILCWDGWILKLILECLNLLKLYLQVQDWLFITKAANVSILAFLEFLCNTKDHQLTKMTKHTIHILNQLCFSYQLLSLLVFRSLFLHEHLAIWKIATMDLGWLVMSFQFILDNCYTLSLITHRHLKWMGFLFNVLMEIKEMALLTVYLSSHRNQKLGNWLYYYMIKL